MRGIRGSVVVEALGYKLEGHVFEIQWGNLIRSICLILLAALSPGVYSASNRNKNVSGEQSAADA
jgi:hypothetical protein